MKTLVTEHMNHPIVYVEARRGDVVHVFTDAELRARDERIIRAAWRESGVPTGARSSDFDAIIAAAEAEDQ